MHEERKSIIEQRHLLRSKDEFAEKYNFLRSKKYCLLKSQKEGKKTLGEKILLYYTELVKVVMKSLNH